jgi:hypothetical protein
MRPLGSDLLAVETRPYFLWDEDVSVGELREALASGNEPERLRLAGKLLREARDTDVWQFLTPADVAALLPKLGRRLGRRAAFWNFLIQGWRADGLI